MEKFIWDKLNYLTSVQNNYQVNDFDEKIKGLELKECLINAGDIQKLSY